MSLLKQEAARVPVVMLQRFAGALGGRLDHTLGNLNSLYTHPHQNIVLVGEGNVVRLLQSGTTHLHVDREVEGKHCGVIPLCEPVTVTSKGLKWDMGTLVAVVMTVSHLPVRSESDVCLLLCD